MTPPRTGPRPPQAQNSRGCVRGPQASPLHAWAAQAPVSGDQQDFFQAAQGKRQKEQEEDKPTPDLTSGPK